MSKSTVAIIIHDLLKGTIPLILVARSAYICTLVSVSLGLRTSMENRMMQQTWLVLLFIT